jgi:hypothetical protein
MEPEKVKINCEGCNKDFSASYIEKHRTKCKNEKIFNCEFCSKKLSTKNNLNEHLKNCRQKIYALYSNLEKENTQIKSQYENKIKEMQSEITLLKSTIHELEMKNKEYEIQHKYINESKNEYKELIGKVSTTIHNTYSNNITLKQIVSKLEPICYEDIKNSMNLFTNEYLDDGIMGFARFLCEHSCNNKIITSDKSRNTIAYRTKFNDFIKDPECINLINKTLQDNSEFILKKSEERREYYRELMDVDDEFETYCKRGAKIQELKKLTQSSLTEKPDDNIKKISNILCNHGIKTYQKTIEQFSS